MAGNDRDGAVHLEDRGLDLLQLGQAVLAGGGLEVGQAHALGFEMILLNLPFVNKDRWRRLQAASKPAAAGHLAVKDKQHALTVEEVIAAYTINAAWALRLDDVTGSIKKGKFADFIVLNHNLFEIPETDIHKTEVQKTIFKGTVVHQED